MKPRIRLNSTLTGTLVLVLLSVVAMGAEPSDKRPDPGGDVRSAARPEAAEPAAKDPPPANREEAAKDAPMEQLALSPQCGFSSTVHGNNIAVEDQRSKLRLVIETAREMWGED